jgi:hypothetical protein
MSKKNLFKLSSEQAKGMTVEKMHQITEVAQKMLDMLQSSSDVEAWVQDHVTTAHDDLMEVYGYLRQMNSEK